MALTHHKIIFFAFFYFLTFHFYLVICSVDSHSISIKMLSQSHNESNCAQQRRQYFLTNFQWNLPTRQSNNSAAKKCYENLEIRHWTFCVEWAKRRNAAKSGSSSKLASAKSWKIALQYKQRKYKIEKKNIICKIQMKVHSHHLTAINNQKQTGKHLAQIPKCMLQFYAFLIWVYIAGIG